MSLSRCPSNRQQASSLSQRDNRLNVLLNKHASEALELRRVSFLNQTLVRECK
jgi:hypothetical protein